MSEKRVKLNQIVKNQVPSYVREDFPLVGEFLSQYYIGQEYKGGPIDLINNIDSYIKLSENANLIKSTLTTKYAGISTETIFVSNTQGFPDNFGLIKINDEVITYESKTNISFVNCTRGFSGITSFTDPSDQENLIFSSSEESVHEKGTTVENLSVLFLDKFLKKTKRQFLHGFQKDLDSKLNQAQFIRQSKDFYSTRGTDESFKILFGAIYGENASVIRPIDNVLSPSNANYRITKDLIVEPLQGNPENLLNCTLFQDEFENISKAYAPISSIEKVPVGILTNTYYKISLDGSFNFPEGSSSLTYGNFSTHAKTKIIGQVGVAQTFIDVDSTLGFPKSGTLSFTYENGTLGVCTYSDKTTNQFLGINTTGIQNTIIDNTSIDQSTFAYGTDLNGNEIRVNIRSVLKNLQIPNKTYYQKLGSKTKIKSLGKISDSFKENNWLFNTAQSYVVQKLSIVDSVNNTFKLETRDPNILRIGDKVATHITSASGSQWGDKITSDFDPISNNLYTVTDVFDENTCLITGSSISDPQKITKVTRRISKIDSDLHPNLNKFTANIQNIYTKPDIGLVNGIPYYGPFHEHEGKKMVGARHVPFPHAFIDPDPKSNKVLVASSSLPFTGVTKLNPKLQKYTFGGTYNLNDEEIKITDQVDHNYFTGDAVYYTPEKTSVKTTLPDGTVIIQQFIASQIFDEGLYYVKRVDSNKVKFARSQSDINSEVFVKVKTPNSVDNVTIKSNDIEKFQNHGKFIESQKLYREFSTPVSAKNKQKTTSGYTGLLINGTEIFNYKSKKAVYYGNLNSIDVVDGGSGYDVINPPTLSITDSVGTGATGTCSVKGSFKDIRVLDSGFDYIEEPIIKITGGNGSGANAVAKLNTLEHEVLFNADGVGLGTVFIGSVSASNVGVNTSSIGFSTHHRFRTGERVIYDPLGGIPLVGLATEAIYYVSSHSEYSIKLHKNYDEATVGVNTISITNFGNGVQSFKSLNGKSILSSVVLLDSGSGYENKERTCNSIGINTALNLINIPNHSFGDGDVIQYSIDGTGVDGLSTSLDYYVTVLDENNFKLSAVGVGTTVKSFYYDTKQYQNLRSVGLGTHKFNYPPINVQVIGKVGITSVSGKNYEAILQPIVRGEITSINLSGNGVGYGASEIIEFNRKPDVNLSSGRDAVITPIVSNGRIVDVSVSYGGTDYNSPPDLVVLGIGSDAKLVPEMNSSGNIISVKIQSGGVGYGVSSTFVRIDPAGKGIKVNPQVQKWTINEFKKNLLNLNDDDVFITDPINNDYGLQCSYVYAPRNLRKITYASDADGKILFGKKDLKIVNGVETDSDSHSPILGYAYDGHPVYGPYGFSNKDGGSVVQLKSGYVEEANKKANRPPASIFPPEFFVEDFTFKPSQDETVLDENNGRFCVTPEFPNGTYAYFATFDKSASSDGIFKNFKKPVFPYLIGDNYNSKPINFNFLRSSSQDFYDLQNSNYIRNTYPYSFNKDYSGYDYLLQSNNFVEQNSTINFAEKGKVDRVGILSAGRNYQVNDTIVFDDSVSSSFKATAKVNLISGLDLSEISASRETISNIEFYPEAQNVFVGIATTSINLLNTTLINVGSLSTTTTLSQGSYAIGIRSEKYVLSQGIGTAAATGIVTFMSISGDLSKIRENDRFKVGVGTEIVKVLNVDKFSSRIRIVRSQSGIATNIGISHTASTVLEEIPRRFTINSGFTTNSLTRRNKEFYFNPNESVGLGTTAGIGVGTFRTINNPGVGPSSVFIPSQAIFIPNHGLRTGDEVTYQTDGTPFKVKFDANVAQADVTLFEDSPLFIAKFDNNFIGLSTVKIGIGSTGTFVGIGSTLQGKVVGGVGLGTVSKIDLTYFLTTGSGDIHSLKTNFKNVVSGEIQRNLVSVVGTGTHGLLNDDTVIIDVNSGLTTTVTVKYNKSNRKALFNPLEFNVSGMTSATSLTGIPNTIEIVNHGLTTGQKIIHTFDGEVSSLVNDREYYVYVIDENKISLVNDKYETTKIKPNFVKLGIATSGTISPINPPLTFYKNSTVNFDLSDSSLSYVQNASSLPAFFFELYTDSNLIQKYFTNGDSSTFEVTNTGTVGVSADAKLTLKINQKTPSLLYYKLNPIDKIENRKENKEIVVDDDIKLNNQIIIKESKYNGSFKITSTGSTTFTYNIDSFPESSYTSTNSSLKYNTISTNAYGGIEGVRLIDGGGGYLNVPGISTITSDVGIGAVLESFSTTIGKVSKTTLENIGFDYPTDNTLLPEVLFPQVLRITPLTGFRSIGVTSLGKGYIQNPNLVVLDGVTKKQITDVDLRYRPDELFVEILQNSESMNATTPTIVPTGNSNGIRVSNLVYDNDEQSVTATIKNAFSGVVGFSGTYIDPFPFTVGDKVLVENASVGVGSTASGFNSANHDYARFEITQVTPNYGGIGTVKYDMSEFLSKNVEFPGVFDPVNSVATLIPDKWFPQFDIKLQPNVFRKGDEVESFDSSGTQIQGTVFDWNNSSKYLTVESNREFENGKLIEQVRFRGERIGGKTYASPTGAKGLIKEIIKFKGNYNLNTFSTVENGWQNITGFLNNQLQRTHDNDYYHAFSYSIKSKVQYDEWKDIVGSLNHTSGFKKFSDFQIESDKLDNSSSKLSSIDPSKGVVTTLVDIIGVQSLYTTYDFDLATENYLVGVEKPFSDEINFQTRLITDYSESVSNRVVQIDDISNIFNNNARSTPYADVYRNKLSDGRVQMFFALVSDRLFTGERQITIVNTLHDTGRGQTMLNQYGDIDTVLDLGSFDYTIDGNESVLRYYPNKFKLNNYNVVLWSYQIDNQRLGISTDTVSCGSTTIPGAPSNPTTGLNGSLISIATTAITIAGGAAGTVFTLGGIGTNVSGHRSAKVLVSVEAGGGTLNGSVEYDQVSLIHDGTNVGFQEYGQLTIHSVDAYSSTGNLGTYFPFMDGNDLVLSYTPEAGMSTAFINAMAIGIATEGYIGIGSYEFSYAEMSAQSTGISSSSSPIPVGIASYGDDYDAAYCIVQIADKLNGSYELTEVVMIDDYDGSDPENVMLTEFGNVKVGTAFAGLGTISARRTGDDDEITELTFVPNAGIGVSITTFMNALRPEENTSLLPAEATREVGGEAVKDLQNASLESGFAIYEGTETSIKKAFALENDGNPIFKKPFDGSSTDVVDLTNNLITLPNHFFTSGQKVNYSAGAGTSIGVGTFSMPSSVFIIKKGEDKVQVALTAENALKEIAVPIGLSTVGIGTSHTFTAIDANQKVLVAIDNAIQSPIAGTSVTTTLDRTATLGDDIIHFTGITSFFGADYIRVGAGDTQEIMKIISVGVGTTNAIKVRRGWLGTTIAGFSTGDLVEKIRGNYNIVENEINFTEAPPGKNPIGTATNKPSERDFVGITTSSSFQGRVFTRSGVTGGTEETYTDNYLFDDITQEFNGLTKVFDLTHNNGTAITGIATNNALILVNGILQAPGSNADFTLAEPSGTTLTWTGSGLVTATRDPNAASIPVGGLIVSVGSSRGFGYQPLIGAGGTAVVSLAGTINSVSIGNTGSGYRAGIQTVSVGLQTEGLNTAGITTIGLASINDGHVSGVTITNPQFFYKPRDIYNVGYSSITGITTITTAFAHNLSVGNEVVVSGIAFTCDYAPAVGVQSANYDNTTGIMTVTTLAAHGLSTTGKSSDVILTGLAFTCGLGATVNHIYPRNRDRFFDTAISVASTTGQTITLDVSKSPIGQQYTHRFIGAASSAVIQGGDYSHTFRYALENAVTTGDGTQFTPTDATYNASTGVFVIDIPNHGLSTSDTVGIGTSSIVFSCEMDHYGSDHPYPRPTDPIAGIQTTITAVTTNTITINVGKSELNFYDVSNADYNAETGVLELTIGTHTLLPGRSIKLKKESLRFTCSKNNYATQHKYPREGDPIFDGTPVIGVASATQFTINAGISTVPTQYVSGGFIQPAIIAPRANNNSASGQDVAFDGASVLRVLNATEFEINSGISTRAHLYARGGRVDQLTKIVIDEPLSYSDIPLVYSGSSPGIGGTEARADVVVSQGSTIIDFKVTNLGFGYGVDQILTLPLAGIDTYFSSVGIPTTSNANFEELELTIKEVHSDQFTGWGVGQLQVLDNFSNLFNGSRRTFPISVGGNAISIQSRPGSLVKVEDTLFVFINDVLQIPGEAYSFPGGATITFDEPPKAEDTLKILFYRGTGGADVVDRDIIATVKVGDTLTLGYHDTLDQKDWLQEKDRSVVEITSSNSVDTNAYNGPGVYEDTREKRPVNWTKQTEDLFIEGKIVSKSRELYDGRIFPTTNLIQSVGVGSTVIYVSNLRPFFNAKNENLVNTDFQKDIVIFNNSERVAAAATAVVSAAGTITSVEISDGGKGYTSAPTITIQNPVGLGTTARAEATATIANGSVSAITVGVQSGIGYTGTNPPVVLIGAQPTLSESNSVVSFSGDSGVISGIALTTVGGITHPTVQFDLVIPYDSDLRNSDITQGATNAITESAIAVGDYFIVKNSNVGSARSSMDYDDDSIVGIGTAFIDNVYRVAAVSGVTTNAIGFGQTALKRVTVSMGTTAGLDQLPDGHYYGDYSFGRIMMSERNVSRAYTVNTSNGVSGIETGVIITRKTSLKVGSYTT